MKALLSALSIAGLVMSGVQGWAVEDGNRRDPTSVYSGDKFLGKDPDPGIRSQMLRDADHEHEN